jgi:hypothetical protein
MPNRYLIRNYGPKDTPVKISLAVESNVPENATGVCEIFRKNSGSFAFLVKF